MALLDHVAAEAGAELTTHIVGVERGARLAESSVHDSRGLKTGARGG
jgi:hypothetical protein